MSKQDVVDRVKAYAAKICKTLNVKMVLLQQSYPGEFDKSDCEIEVVVVVDLLNEDQDYIEIRAQLEEMAHDVYQNLDPVLVEEAKEDLTGFYNEIRKTGEVIYNTTNY